MKNTGNEIIVSIATAHKRYSKKWSNNKMAWPELVQRCSQTKRTDETIKEYLKMTREEQADIKDVGGFVGGYLSNGTRKNGNVLYRSMATLDLDFATTEAWEDFTMLFDCAALFYTTHKHTKEKPRFRLVIPFNRDVTPQEYEPICRRIAENIGIEQFDTTTYELPRLFYWPSTSKDGQFIFEEQKGQALNADEVLATYEDWHDVSQWPMGSRENERICREMKKAGDPTEKNGLIGAFCRAYTIEDAIEKFLPDVYERTAHDGRYTYKMGSVAGGLVCYDGKFAYSHHDTDPASRQLCNAFDLVRIHKFGVMDDGTEAQDITKRPSYIKMCDFVAADKETCKLMAVERKQEADSIFAGVTGGNENEAEPEQTEWLADLERDKKGNAQNTNRNRVLIARNDEKLKAIGYDLFKQEFSVTDPNSRFASLAGAGLDNISAAKIAGYIEDAYGLKVSYKEIVPKLLYILQDERGFNPVKDFILAEQWDGTPRAERLLIDYLGADDTELNRAITRIFLTAAVARVFKPGCKFDYVLTLQGPQGIGKSMFLSAIAGQWFNGNFSFSVSVKEQREILADSWIVESAELAGMKKADVESAKAFISNQEDKYRRPYNPMVEHFPRHCVIAATTNEDYFLRSTTGDRRWWIVAVHGKGEAVEWLDELKANVGQIWAEAYTFYEATQGERLCLPPHLEKQAREMQERYNVAEGDPLLAPLQEWLDVPLPNDWRNRQVGQRAAYFRTGDPFEVDETQRHYRDKICVQEIKDEFPHPEIRRYTSQQIGQLMNRCKGWRKADNTIRIFHYGKTRGWIREQPFNPNEDAI